MCWTMMIKIMEKRLIRGCGWATIFAAGDSKFSTSALCAKIRICTWIGSVPGAVADHWTRSLSDFLCKALPARDSRDVRRVAKAVYKNYCYISPPAGPSSHCKISKSRCRMRSSYRRPLGSVTGSRSQRGPFQLLQSLFQH